MCMYTHYKIHVFVCINTCDKMIYNDGDIIGIVSEGAQRNLGLLIASRLS